MIIKESKSIASQLGASDKMETESIDGKIDFHTRFKNKLLGES